MCRASFCCHVFFVSHKQDIPERGVVRDLDGNEFITCDSRVISYNCENLWGIWDCTAEQIKVIVTTTTTKYTIWHPIQDISPWDRRLHCEEMLILSLNHLRRFPMKTLSSDIIGSSMTAVWKFFIIYERLVQLALILIWSTLIRTYRSIPRFSFHFHCIPLDRAQSTVSNTGHLQTSGAQKRKSNG